MLVPFFFTMNMLLKLLLGILSVVRKYPTRDGMTARRLEKAGNAEKLFVAQAVVLATRTFITSGKCCIVSV